MGWTLKGGYSTSSRFNTKDNFSFKLIPTIWVCHDSREVRRKHAVKSKNNRIYDYTSIYIGWITFSAHITLGRV